MSPGQISTENIIKKGNSTAYLILQYFCRWTSCSQWLIWMAFDENQADFFCFLPLWSGGTAEHVLSLHGKLSVYFLSISLFKIDMVENIQLSHFIYIHMKPSLYLLLPLGSFPIYVHLFQLWCQKLPAQICLAVSTIIISYTLYRTFLSLQ